MADPPQQDVYLDDARLEVAPFIPRKTGPVLDVGCGKGGFGRTLREALGPEVRIVGVEANERQAAVARSDHGYDDVIHGYYPEAIEGDDTKFDSVFFLDVLEHVIDPWGMLERVRVDLAPGGTVVAAIPSIEYAPVVRELWRGRWDYADTGTLDRTHVRFFTRATMIEMFEGAGYDVRTIEGTGSVWAHHWHTRTWRRRLWLWKWPNSEWLHFVIVAVPRGDVSAASPAAAK
jgi:2-polyprenyl-3-methyl-5-hydroxy-6-metoxy-1,4-benzoquinol methylase